MGCRVHLREVSSESKPIIERLYQFYRHDLSEFNQQDIGENGRFHHIDLDQYFSDESRKAFLFDVDASLAGFSLVNLASHEIEGETAHNLDDFFVLRKFRRKGIGTCAAISLFHRYPGIWQVNKKTYNIPAMKFWPVVIPMCTDGAIQEHVVLTDIHIHIFRVRGT